MSDDTPTQRLGSDGEDAPTEILATPADDTAPLVAEERKNRRLIIILASIGGALLLALLIVLILLLTRSNAEPGAALTPTPTKSSTLREPVAERDQVAHAHTDPTPTPTATAAPDNPPDKPPTALKIDKFTGTSSVSCNSDAPSTPEYPVYFEWKTSNAVQVYFGVATADASQGALFDNLPANGNSDDDFPYPQMFPCPNPSQNYTLTIVAGNGDKISKNIIIKNVGDKQ